MTHRKPTGSIVSASPGSAVEYGLIIQQPGKPQAVLRSFVAPMLSFRYGLHTIEASSFHDAVPAIRDRMAGMRCVFLIQDKELQTDVGISGLNLMGRYPLFVLAPQRLSGYYQEACAKMKNAFVCSWEDAFRKGGSFLSEMVESAFETNGIGRPFEGKPQSDYADLQLQVEARLGDLQALPTLPGVVRKILHMLKNPATTIDELEAVLSTDPVIVQKIRQVVASPLFAGHASNTAKFTLKDAIVRIGLKEIGAIAMQLMVVNSFVEVSGTLFDFKRFWGHSVGCALAADKIYKSKIVKFADELAFQDYWLGGLLHDIGKLVLGVFFWDHFSRVLGETVLRDISFREAERELGDAVNHEEIGKLLLLKADFGPEITEWVAVHDSASSPDSLFHLLHIANNLCKDLGLSYPQESAGRYSPEILSSLSLSEDDIASLRDNVGAELVAEVKELLRGIS